MFDKLIEEKIREAMEAGEFDDLPGKGKPIDLEAYFSTPADLRLAYSVLKSAKCLPEEVQLLKEIEEMKAKLPECSKPAERKNLETEIKAKELKLSLLLDSRRSQRRK